MQFKDTVVTKWERKLKKTSSDWKSAELDLNNKHKRDMSSILMTCVEMINEEVEKGHGFFSVSIVPAMVQNRNQLNDNVRITPKENRNVTLELVHFISENKFEFVKNFTNLTGLDITLQTVENSKLIGSCINIPVYLRFVVCLGNV